MKLGKCLEGKTTRSNSDIYDMFFNLQTRIKLSPLFQKREKNYAMRCLFC